MEKIKDFIYDKSDLVIALLILIIAAVIIFWRMGVILDYPKTLLGTGDTSQTQDVNQSGDDASDDASGDADTEDGDDNGDQTTEDGNTSDSDAASGDLFVDGTLTRDITVDMQGNTALLAINCLVDAGLFENYDEYKALCSAQGLNDEKVSGGEITFTKGMTKAQIAKKVNWS